MYILYKCSKTFSVLFVGFSPMDPDKQTWRRKQEPTESDQLWGGDSGEAPGPAV